MALLVLLAAEAHGQSPERKLHEPFKTIDCADFIGHCNDLEAWQGCLYLLDPEKRVIWRLDDDGRKRDKIRPDSGGANFKSPFELEFGYGERLLVTEMSERYMSVFDIGREAWSKWPLGHRAAYCGADADGLVINSHRTEDAHLVEHLDRSGNRTLIGRSYRGEDESDKIVNAMNWAKLDIEGDHVVVGHIGLGLIRVFRTSGVEMVSFELLDESADRVRRNYLHHKYGTLRDDVTYDLAAAEYDLKCSDGPLPVYISDIKLKNESIYVMVGSDILVYDLRGNMLSAHALRGEVDGRLVFCHAFTIDDSAHIIGMDTEFHSRVHYYDGIVR